MKPIRVQHPGYGYVEFHGMSIRQIEILNEVNELNRLKKLVQEPNDQTLGASIRKLLNKKK